MCACVRAFVDFNSLPADPTTPSHQHQLIHVPYSLARYMAACILYLYIRRSRYYRSPYVVYSALRISGYYMVCNACYECTLRTYMQILNGCPLLVWSRKFRTHQQGWKNERRTGTKNERTVTFLRERKNDRTNTEKSPKKNMWERTENVFLK